MIGRAAIGYPWIFNEIKHFVKTGEKLPAPGMEERVKVARQHLAFSLEWKSERQGIYEMRRHYTNYFRGIPNFKPFRSRLVTSENPQELFELLDEIAAEFSDAYAMEGDL